MGSGFLDNVLGIGVITQTDEGCVSQMVGFLLLSKFNFRDDLGLDPGQPQASLR